MAKMDTDFPDAHERHWEDAELLRTAARFPNADHLFGMSAECGLKCLMLGFGMKTDASGTPGRQDRKHADEIWDHFETNRSGHYQGAGYVLPTPNPFADWDVNQRYANRGDFDEVRVNSHRAGVETVRKLIAKASKEGLL